MGVLDREERGDDNGTGLKEEGGIEMSTTVLPLRDARSPSLEILTFATDVITTTDNERRSHVVGIDV